MLNRIYIVVGLIAILVLAGAFIVPRFVQWGDYRDRMEALASDVLGADVSIRGDIAFSLLPQPRLQFSDVLVGSADDPIATVAGVEAEFELINFLRDDYDVTALVLREPAVRLEIDENGLFGAEVALAEAGHGVALGQARIVDGRIELTDRRSGTTSTASDIDGDLRLASFVGPFQFQGLASAEQRRYEVRFNSGTVDTDGRARTTSYLRDIGSGMVFSTEGMLTPGVAPRFEGTLVYRVPPEEAATADEIAGDLVFESAVTAITDRVVLTGFVLHPDETRAGMRLTGAASIQLGASPSFDAAVSGGVFNLPPRDATEVPSELPYELVRLVSELPAPLVPPLPGKIGIDLAEVGIRGAALRNVRVEATTDGQSWQVLQAIANLPGETELRLSGEATSTEGVLGFRGDLVASSARLDGLAQLWRRPEEDSPLFNMPGRLEGQVLLTGEALGLTGGWLTLDGQRHAVEVRLGFGEERRLDLVGHFDGLDARHTAALQALLPDPANESSFAISFPTGSFALTATAMDVFGLSAETLVADGQWAPGRFSFTRLSAADWGGISLSAALDATGTLAAPRVTGAGQISIASTDSAGLATLYELAAVPYAWQQALGASWPAALEFSLADGESDASQVLTLAGDFGAGALDLRLEFSGGLAEAATGDLRLVASLEAQDGAALSAQLGAPDQPILGDGGPVLATLFLEGTAANGLEGRANLSAGDERLGYVGSVRLADDGTLVGEGTMDVRLFDASGLAALAGLEGAGLGGFAGSGAISFQGADRFTLADFAGQVGDTALSGEVSMQHLGQLPSYSGTLRFDEMHLEALAAAYLGRAALIGAVDVTWPEGPLAQAAAPRPSRGTIAVTATGLRLGGDLVAGETGFDFVWEPASVGLDGFETSLGGGSLSLDLGQCCAGPAADRTLSGRVMLDGVNLEAVLPGAGGRVAGTVDGSLQFEGTGPSLDAVVGGLSGEGNFTLRDLTIAGLDPGVYPAVAGFTDALDADEDTLQAFIGVALGQGEFGADTAQGAFTIAGGVVRLANLIIEGAGAQLAGSLELALADLGLSGSFVLTPRDLAETGGLVQPETARILARLAGTFLAPDVTLDLSEFAAAVQVRANELEVDRLDALRREDEERQRAAAEARKRLADEQRRAAEAEAARRAAEEEALRLEQERLQQQQQAPTPATPPPTLQGPIDLGFDPVPQAQPLDWRHEVNQPDWRLIFANLPWEYGYGVNRFVGQPVNQLVALAAR